MFENVLLETTEEEGRRDGIELPREGRTPRSLFAGGGFIVGRRYGTLVHPTKRPQVAQYSWADEIGDVVELAQIILDGRARDEQPRLAVPQGVEGRQSLRTSRVLEAMPLVDDEKSDLRRVPQYGRVHAEQLVREDEYLRLVGLDRSERLHQSKSLLSALLHDDSLGLTRPSDPLVEFFRPVVDEGGRTDDDEPVFSLPPVQREDGRHSHERLAQSHLVGQHGTPGRFVSPASASRANVVAVALAGTAPPATMRLFQLGG
mmetsp:Transcript_58771/g.174876  ORF Transcript_58771/g.174876 Transcript_58771/m.174876 type:complete len:260 (-) Transcript_58771:158-937(-)